MKIYLNGEDINLEHSITVEKLLELYNIDKNKVAIERNMEILNRSEYQSVSLNEGDKLEVIHFIGGG